MGVVLAPIPASQRMVALPDPLEESVPAMKINWILLPCMLFVVSLFAVSTATADAADDGQVKVVTVAAEDAAEATTDEKASCCPAPCITYRQRGRCRKVCCGCDPPREDNPQGCRSLLLQDLLRHSHLPTSLLQGRTLHQRPLWCLLQGSHRLQVVLRLQSQGRDQEVW